MNSVSITVNNNNTTIELLTSNNLKRLRFDIEFKLYIANIDIVLWVDKPPKRTNESFIVKKEYYTKCEKSKGSTLLL